MQIETTGESQLKGVVRESASSGETSKTEVPAIVRETRRFSDEISRRKDQRKIARRIARHVCCHTSELTSILDRHS